jgi:hypothetical protein
MSEPDYYSVMKKRIDYWAKKYDPYGRFSSETETYHEKITTEETRKIRKKISAGYTHVISMLF